MTLIGYYEEPQVRVGDLVLVSPRPVQQLPLIRLFFKPWIGRVTVGFPWTGWIGKDRACTIKPIGCAYPGFLNMNEEGKCRLSRIIRKISPLEALGLQI